MKGRHVSLRHPIRLVALCLPAVALTAALASGALAAPHRAAAPRIPACGSGQLVSWLNTSGNGYAGGIGYELQFTNLSTRACTLFGFPGVSAVTLAGRQIGGAAFRSGTATRTVVVRAGATARALLQIVDTGNFPPSACRPVTAAGLRVYAAGLRTSNVIPFPFSVCSVRRTASLQIQATT